MSTTVRRYSGYGDYLRIREFLIDTFEIYGRPLNWLIDRWNFTRHFAAPVHTFYNVRYFDIPTLTHDSIRDEVEVWERTIWLWETESGDLAGVVHADNEGPGNAFLQVHPDHVYLCAEMLDHAERHLADRVDGVAFIKVHISDGTELESLVAGRGYTRLGGNPHLQYHITGSERPGPLPDGFSFGSVAEEDNIDERRKAKSIAFGGDYAPSSWPPAWTFREMQRAPDYRPELDIYIRAPGGECAAFATIWVDERNRYAVFEPVGTRADYQGMGLGTALLSEGFRLMGELGAERSFMDSTNPFYRRVGFEETAWVSSRWMKYLDA